MNKQKRIGPLLACAIGDSYGAGFEFTPVEAATAHNDLTGYIQHPKWQEMKPGHYTDDTQMALALAEHMLEGAPWNPLALADRWVNAFRRDPRPGYAGGFYKFLEATKTGADFLAGVRPNSKRSGGAMRAFPIGFLTDVDQVRDLAMFQASLTHATHDGMCAAAAAALMFHHRYHRVGLKADLPQWLDALLPGVGLAVPWKGRVDVSGISCVRAALTAYMQNDNLYDALHQCIAWTGDTDTVAAICMSVASVCGDMEGNLPDALLKGLENGNFGRGYLRSIDRKLAKKFPVQEGVKVEAQPEDDVGLLDFLFSD